MEIWQILQAYGDAYGNRTQASVHLGLNKDYIGQAIRRKSKTLRRSMITRIMLIDQDLAKELYAELKINPVVSKQPSKYYNCTPDACDDYEECCVLVHGGMPVKCEVSE